MVVDPPPLPPGLGRMSTVVVVGTALWLLGAAAALVAWLVVGRALDIWFSTCLAGALLGGLGYGVYSWQRATARRGSRTAQQGLE